MNDEQIAMIAEKMRTDKFSAQTKIVDMYYREEWRHFRENFENRGNYNDFVKALEQHIFYSILILKHSYIDMKGVNHHNLSIEIKQLWDEIKEVDDEEEADVKENAKVINNDRQILKVSYWLNDIFVIPTGINLEDESIIESYGVKYNVLKIYFRDGRILEIDSEGWINDPDLKHHEGEAELLDAEYYIDDEKFDERSKQILEELPPKPEPKPEPEPEQKIIVMKIDFEGKKYLKDKCNGDIYDYDAYVKNAESIIVGVWNKETQKIDFK